MKAQLNMQLRVGNSWYEVQKREANSLQGEDRVY